MRLLSLALLLLIAVCATPASAQPPREVRPPPALARQLFADVDADSEFKRNGLQSVLQGTSVERVNLNGDGVGEWLVTGTRFCGTNCQYWVYRRLPDGRFQQVYEGGGVQIQPLPARSNGWRSLMVRAHMSCCESFFTRHEFDGRRYRWRDTEYRGDTDKPRSRLIYHLSITNPDARGRRRLALDPMDAGGGLRISARYDVCARQGQCGAPELVLRSARFPARRTCVGFSAHGMDGSVHRSAGGPGWCGEPAAVAGTAERELVLQPSLADWGRLYSVMDADLTGPGLPGRLDSDATGALMMFVDRLNDFQRLPCFSRDGCR
ncbi:MAG TPA: hypothetical protein VF111_03870 [Thermoanaerobaculia bacterium]